MILRFADFAERAARPAAREAAPPRPMDVVEEFVRHMVRRRGEADALTRVILADALNADELAGVRRRIRGGRDDSGKISS